MEVWAGSKDRADKIYASLKAIESKDIAENVKHIMEMPIYMGIHDIVVLPLEQK